MNWLGCGKAAEGWASTRSHSLYLPNRHCCPFLPVLHPKGWQVQEGQLVLWLSGDQGGRAVSLGETLSPLASSTKLSWSGSVFDQGPSLLSQKPLSELPPSWF